MFEGNTSAPLPHGKLESGVFPISSRRDGILALLLNGSLSPSQSDTLFPQCNHCNANQYISLLKMEKRDRKPTPKRLQSERCAYNREPTGNTALFSSEQASRNVGNVLAANARPNRSTGTELGLPP